MRFTHFFLLLLICALSMGSAAHAGQPAPDVNGAEVRDFTRFSAALPAGWDGEERTGFHSGKAEECMLILGVKDQAGENYQGLVSIFVLPNDKQTTSESFARELTRFQADATEPAQEGRFWVFTGEPRSQAFKAPALTKVHATPEMVLIAIIQDPEGLGGQAVFESLRGLTPQTRQLLGK
ncbi:MULTISPECIES: hypothetical protein [Desulfovibrio]|uniref:Protoporphyrinogen oxidase n=2 Tax=Desulfovibrio desulfuricans TaxID=876 RepID=A0AA94HT69_DESDE|nr:MULTISPECIES: hypothetical protein [Desulfovibrio]ATD80714.1 protoporphyrinogen oxidase [Desulfovibrio sp. G11]SFW52366.1 hypothetical protein SAMN02910291_01682 [Desulfovibrio desulfuricans]SPD36238.1 Hypothetical protein DSVG11_2146 [Desulfovibrio sp. G11]